MANEVRLIDANASALTDRINRNFGSVTRFIIKIILKDAPTIDPESLRPVGRWEKVRGYIHSSGYAIRCTRCGKYHFVHYRGLLGGLYGHDELFVKPPSCPSCGAKMMEG